MSALIDKYTKEELEVIVKQSSSLREVILKLGYKTAGGANSETVKKRLEAMEIDVSHFTFTKGVVRTVENIFIENSTATQATLRRWYVQKNYSPYVCSICGQEPIW